MRRHFFLWMIFFPMSFSTLFGAEGDKMDSRTSLLTDALKFQDKGEYDKALVAYQEVLDSGHKNGHLFYNMGIAYYRMNRVGESMAAFLAARRYLPRDPDVGANLRFLQKSIKDQLDFSLNLGPMSGMLGFLNWFTIYELATFLVISVVGVSIIQMLGLLVPAAKSLWRLGLFLLIMPVAVAGAVVFRFSHDYDWGAVKAAHGAKVYSGPSDSNTVLFELQQGAPLGVMGDERQNFLPIAISDGKKGWINLGDIALFR